MSKEDFSKEEKQLMIDSVSYWWHHVDVGDGVITPGKQGNPTSTKYKLSTINLPMDLSGKTVLDLGCADGFFSFECERRGARKVVALDHKNHNCEKGFKVLHTILGSNVEYVEADLLKLDTNALGTFDIVLFLGILYHLRYPLQGIDAVRKLTKELAIIETWFLVNSDDKIMRYHAPLNTHDHCTWEISRPCLESILTNAGFKHSVLSTITSRITYHLK